jgi:signal transduction histidine kinase
VRIGSLRARVTLAAVAAVVIAVIILGVGARLIVNAQMRSSLDGSLRSRATDVARLAVSAPAVLNAPGALEAPVAGRQLTVEVLTRHRAIVARSLALGAKLLPSGPAVTAALRGHSGFSDFRLDGEPSRMFVAPIADAGGPAAGGVVIVAASTRDIESTMHRLTLLLLLCGLGAAIMGGVAAAFLTRRGLLPLRRLSASAASIECSGDSSERLPEPASKDEVGELGGTLNRMLTALDAAALRERRFLADASHELRTPLTALVGNVDYLARHGADSDLVADLVADTERLRLLLDDLLALEREHGAEDPSELVDLDQLVSSVTAKTHGVTLDVQGPVMVIGEPRSLRRMLENLVENAQLHGPPQGEVTVRLAARNGQAELSVSDQGPGLNGANAKDAFERFWRGADAAGKPGSGLGLAIVKATAERHHGTVGAEGSTITVTMPQAH